jgi:chemotaxis protein MotB
MKHMKHRYFSHSISVITLTIATLTLSSCVSLSEMEALQARYDQTAKQYSVAQNELLELREENASIARQNQTLNADYADMALAKEQAENRADSLATRIEQLSHHYDTTMENYIQQVAGKSRDLTRAQNLLTARTKELADKERELQARQTQFAEQQEAFALERSNYQAKQAQLLEKQRQLEQQEAATRAQLQAKQNELENLKNNVSKALTGFADKGLNIETRDGKVYISLENKLLFPSASWTVSKDGVAAIKQLAMVLEQDTTLNIIVEGHTDNDPYRGSTAVKDNWDLSVMRATAIVKLLLQNGKAIDPARIQACGHGEFSPKVPNDTPEHKAANRRTEIIISPRLETILQQVQQ